MEIFKAFDYETLELIVFMVIPVVVYLAFVIVTLNSSDSSIINSENDHWIRATAKYNQRARDGLPGGGDIGQPSPVRIEMLSNGMMIQRGGKPRKFSKSAV